MKNVIIEIIKGNGAKLLNVSIPNHHKGKRIKQKWRDVSFSQGVHEYLGRMEQDQGASQKTNNSCIIKTIKVVLTII